MAGRHLHMDCRAPLHLSDRDAIVDWMREAARQTGMTVLGNLGVYLPGPLDSGPGVSAVMLIAESHLCCHTWPEHGVITMDFYSCRDFDPKPVLASFCETFGVTEVIQVSDTPRWGFGAELEPKADKQPSLAQRK